jgi:hypothetical protein
MDTHDYLLEVLVKQRLEDARARMRQHALVASTREGSARLPRMMRNGVARIGSWFGGRRPQRVSSSPILS